MKGVKILCTVLIPVWVCFPALAGTDVPVTLMSNSGEEVLYLSQEHRRTPPGDRAPLSILMAPADYNYQEFFADVAACTGATVDYFDARAATPSVELMATYDCVATWVWSPYHDNVQMGDNLAAYVDAGGMVIMGQFCLPTMENYLAGAIMGSEYCPVTGTTYDSFVTYNGDGTDCVHQGITTLESYYIDVVVPRVGALWGGTFDNPSHTPVAVWRADRRVWYSPGQMAGMWSTGQWAEIMGNMFLCREYGDILYAPSDDDDPALRAAISGSCGLTVDYFDAGVATPSVGRLAEYDLVFTRPYHAYADDVQMGDNLAAYVDGGGRVILGQWCLHTAGNHLEGAIMDPAYCPVTGTYFVSGSYSGDGTDCALQGITTLYADYVDVITPVAGALTDGTFNSSSTYPALAWRPDRRVYYSPGNMGAPYSSGQWGDLICNIYNCGNTSPTLSCAISATPASGVLPFTTQFSLSLDNLYDGQIRRLAARIDIQLANGGHVPNWRAGHTNVAPLGTYASIFNFNVPVLGPLVGDNSFDLTAEDVTPAPYNQPPYPMSGDTCTGVQVITGIAP